MNVVVGYTWEADTWCPECLPVDENSEEVGVIFDTNEWDSNVYCNNCHELLLEGYMKQCTICKQDLDGKHTVEDTDGNLMHYKCWKDTVPPDVKDFDDFLEENTTQEWTQY